MTKRYIAIIYEGVKTEKQLIDNLNKNFFSSNKELVSIMLPAGQNLYMLWLQLVKDEFTTDIIEVLRERSEEVSEILKDYNRNDFMEIYLFFDYHGHNDNLPIEYRNTDVIAQMLEVFSEETDLGKLYINYPMVESLRDNYPVEEEQCFRRCQIELTDVKDYKKTVHEIKKYQDFRNLTKEDWENLRKNTLCKLNCMVKDSYKMPDRETLLEELTQKHLYEKQKEKYISQNKIGIINSFPIFLEEYFKEGILRQI